MVRETRFAGLLALVLPALTRAAHATLGIYLCAALLSWDSPSSQHQDELASQSIPWADSLVESVARARITRSPPVR